MNPAWVWRGDKSFFESEPINPASFRTVYAARHDPTGPWTGNLGQASLILTQGLAVLVVPQFSGSEGCPSSGRAGTRRPTVFALVPTITFRLSAFLLTTTSHKVFRRPIFCRINNQRLVLKVLLAFTLFVLAFTTCGLPSSEVRLPSVPPR